jgi:hypothetical protein
MAPQRRPEAYVFQALCMVAWIFAASCEQSSIHSQTGSTFRDTAFVRVKINGKQRSSSTRTADARLPHHRQRAGTVLWPDRPTEDAKEERCRGSHGQEYFDQWAASNFTYCAPIQAPGMQVSSSIRCYSDPGMPQHTACVSRNIILDSNDFMGPRKKWRHHAGNHFSVQADGKEGSVRAACEVNTSLQHFTMSANLKPWFQTSLKARALPEHHVQCLSTMCSAPCQHLERGPACRLACQRHLSPTVHTACPPSHAGTPSADACERRTL